MITENASYLSNNDILKYLYGCVMLMDVRLLNALWKIFTHLYIIVLVLINSGDEAYRLSLISTGKQTVDSKWECQIYPGSELKYSFLKFKQNENKTVPLVSFIVL